jgi:hypothetical protein
MWYDGAGNIACSGIGWHCGGALCAVSRGIHLGEALCSIPAVNLSGL